MFYKNTRPGFIFFILLSSAVQAQFYNLPAEYSFSLLTQRRLAAKDSSIHPGMQPYVPFFSEKYTHVPDSHRIFKFITQDPALDVLFFKHVINVEPKDEKFKLRLDPLLNLEYGRDLADSTGRKLYTNTRGFIGSGSIGEKFYFETLLAENQSVFPSYITNTTNITKVVPGQGRWKTFKITGFDYAFSSAFVSIQAVKNLNIQVGHGKHKIGNGYRSLLLSDNAFNYPYARFTHQWLKGRLQYTNIYAVLTNLVPASKLITTNTERLFQKKPAAFQYLSFNPHKRLNVSFFQGMMWQAGDSRNRLHLDWRFFNPLIFSNLAAYQLNHRNNILAGGDVILKISDRISFYSQVMADHLLNNDSVKKGLGFQGGIKIFDLLKIRNLFLQLEYNQAGAGAYIDPDGTATEQSFTHYNQVLAYTPVNGTEFVVISDYKKHRFFANIRYSYQVKQPSASNFSYTSLVNAKIGYVINPSYNLNVALGVNNRTQKFSTFSNFNNQTNYIYLALRTNIYNLYYDF